MAQKRQSTQQSTLGSPEIQTEDETVQSAVSAQVMFHIAKGEVNLGPWTMDEIFQRVSMAELVVTDFVYDDLSGDWIPLLECEAFRTRMLKQKPKAPPLAMAQAAAQQPKSVPQVRPEPQASMPPVEVQPKPENNELTPEGGAEWFVQRGAQRYGPMAYLDLVRALQEKSAYDFDFIWCEGMESWVRIAEHDLFQPEYIRALAETLTKDESSTPVFFQRQHARIRFDSEVIVHDDQSVWMGQAFEASVGGSGLVIETTTLTPGQVVRLHFAPCDGLPAFNALGEIVAKRFQKEVRDTKSPVRYAVRFLKLDGSAEPQVREYFAKQSEANKESASLR